MESVSFDDLVQSFRKVGLQPGDIVNVHSRLHSIGLVCGVTVPEIPQAFLSALVEVIGDDGTVVVPTFTTSFGRYGTPFVLEESPSEMGVFSEHVRKSPGALRTLHPIQSLSALGGQAQALTEDHPTWNVGHDTIWERMLNRDAKVLTIGIPLRRAMSFVHHLEFLACVPYLYHKLLSGEVFSGGDRVSCEFQLSARYLQFEIAYDLSRLEADLEAVGAVEQASLGGNAIWIVPMKAAFEVGMHGLRQDPYYFLQKYPAFLAGEIPCDGTTIEREQIAPKYFLA